MSCFNVSNGCLTQASIYYLCGCMGCCVAAVCVFPINDGCLIGDYINIFGQSCSCRDGWPCRVYLSFSKGHLSLSFYLSFSLSLSGLLFWVSSGFCHGQSPCWRHYLYLLYINIFNGSPCCAFGRTASALVCSRSRLNPYQTEQNLVWYKLYHELSRWYYIQYMDLLIKRSWCIPT